MEGEARHSLGRKLLILVVIKLIIIFIILRLIFFPDFLKSRFRNDRDRADYVKEQLIQRNTSPSK